ncbi:MAG: stage V sporulation protein AA [Tissierellaceae bacterium]|nr:stage V sporulation protein AA [Tissierellaceae bacterium]
MDKVKVYLLIKSKAAIDVRSNIYIKDIGEVYCNDKTIKSKIENISIYKTKTEEDWMSISSINIVEKLVDKHPNLDIEVLGSTDVLIEIKTQVEGNKFFQFIKVVAIFILLFFGSGITIMNFHTDVEMDKSIEILYHALSGEKVSNPLAFTVPYSFGIGLGVIIFFNRLMTNNMRRKKEPGPMEIELYNYDREMEDYILNDINKSNKE